MTRHRAGYLYLLLLLTAVFTTTAQDRTRILFVVDGSLSMNNQWKGGMKWNTAKSVLGQLADSIARIPNVEMGLRVFGHQYPEPDKNCKDSRLEVRIDSNNARNIKRKLEEIRPNGITPLVYSIERSAADFGSPGAKNILIIITDGEDACSGDPCSAAMALQQNNIVLKPFIIGMQLNPKSFDVMECIGQFYNTGSATEFEETLNRIVNEAIAKTTIQVNLLDTDQKPTETNVNMTLYDTETGLARYNFYHTLNTRGLPDTIAISPLFKYKIQVHTLPPLYADLNDIQKNRHNTVSLYAPQGYIRIKLQGTAARTQLNDRIRCLVHEAGKSETLNIQDLNTTDKYIAGNYDLEILTLPPTFVRNVEVTQSNTTDIIVPAPGLLSLSKNGEIFGAVFLKGPEGLTKVCDLNPVQRAEILPLQPGKYTIIYRAGSSRSIHSSVDKEFEITSGGSVSLKL